MSRKKKLSPFESVQREIARRLKNKLPLAGMIAATTLLCGCDELPGGKPVGIAPREDAANCERQTEQTKPKTPPRNQKNETVDPASTRGRFPSMKTDK